MPNTVKSFNDTSAVSLAYVFSDGNNEDGVTETAFKYIPYTTEGFQMSKEPKMSTAITNDRRPNNSKNTKGTASGAATIEFGAAPFALDMLEAALMGNWVAVDDDDPEMGQFITDDAIRKYLCIEKTSRAGPDATDELYHERYYGTSVNDATLEFGDGELITFALNFMSSNADYATAVAGVDGLGGSLASVKDVPEEYEIADSSNNLKSVVVKDENGSAMEMVFSDLSLQIQNNVREQSGLGHEFAAGIGVGKVAATLSGEVYFYDQTLLRSHMDNKRLSAEFQVATREGTFTFMLPNLMVQTPTNNAEGENQDYMTSLTLAGEKGEINIGGQAHTCVMAVTFVPAE